MVDVKKERNSNLELYRVIVMLLIVAHHYVVNSGLFQLMEFSPLSGNSLFLYLFGMWGKTGINCFVLITGYFMCKSDISISKFLKLLLEVFFYEVVIYSIFLSCGVVSFNWKSLFFALIPIDNVGRGFITSFIFFYLSIPFLNILLRNMSKRQHKLLIIYCLFIYTIWAFYPFTVMFNYVTWFIILFFISSYIRLYPIKRDGDVKFWSLLTFCSVILSCLSVILLKVLDVWWPYKFMQDSNSIMALVTAVCSFMLFKNLKIKQSKVVNLMGASTFGVLLIHANSDAMRQWLWKDTLENVSWFESPYLLVHATLSVLVIFILCVFIDQIRIRFIEKPFFSSSIYVNLENNIQKFLWKIS